MKRIVVLLGLSVVGCGNQELSVQKGHVVITDRPPRVAGCASRLSVPETCPVWAPGGGDVDTPEPPFVSGVAIMCGVDDAGRSYGIATGDAPTGHLNVLPGNHELGVYVGFERDSTFTPDKVILTGASANVAAAAGPYNIDITTGDACCPEAHPDAQRAVTMVAIGEHGILFSFGSFDATPLQVVFSVGGDGLFAPESPGPNVFSGSESGRFYVNGPP